MNSSDSQPATKVHSPAETPPANPRRLRWLLSVLVLLGLATAGGYAYRGWLLALPDIPTINTSGADAEVVAAIEKSRSQLQSSPRSGQAWGDFAMVLHANGFDEAADTSYGAAQLLEPGNPKWPYLQGYLHHNGPGGPAKALPCFERAAGLGPRHSMARVRMADMLLALSELDQAEQQYQQVAAAQPGEPHVQLGLAKLAVARNQTREALQYLASVADDPFVRSRACELRASLYERLGDKTAAKQERQRLAALPGDGLRPDDVVAEVIERQIGVRSLIAQAQGHWQEKRTRQMVAVLRETVQRYPQSDVAWSSLATALSATGDLEGSGQALKRSIELAPKTATYRISLGKLLTGQKRYEEALQELHAAVSLSPRHGPAHLALGECLLEQGDEKGAAESFTATLRYAPGDSAARRYLDQLGSSRGSK